MTNSAGFTAPGGRVGSSIAIMGYSRYHLIIIIIIIIIIQLIVFMGYNGIMMKEKSKLNKQAT